MSSLKHVRRCLILTGLTLTFDPIFLSMSSTRTFCWMYISSGDLPGASSRFIPPAPDALLSNRTQSKRVFNYSYLKFIFRTHELNTFQLAFHTKK